MKEVEENVSFYTQIFGFEIINSFGKMFAKIGKGNLIIWLSGPNTSATKPVPNEDIPVGGGWNRFVIQVDAIQSIS